MRVKTHMRAGGDLMIETKIGACGFEPQTPTVSNSEGD